MSNKTIETVCNILGVLAYIFLSTMAVAFFIVGICIFIAGDFSIFDIFGMVGCFGAGWMINDVRKGR